MKKQEKKFPRQQVIDRQLEKSAEKLQLKNKLVVRTALRAGGAKYGLPTTRDCTTSSGAARLPCPSSRSVAPDMRSGN
jgi:hypothetical protein